MRYWTLFLCSIIRSAVAVYPRTHHPPSRRGKTDGEIRRTLKRQIARKLYRPLNAAAA
jgi:hypothetical protein